ncbi:hypothetical protein ACFOLJ_28310 [Rugamonas sp. CCM 8940]|uniref:alpha/beta fold hydrolase n=1 Tax=Rugamonas sp. CCM 8940 TaxID=2765359 RepID=UPI0018F4C7C0|nr:alpha/beta hydrolase [Rugamonas sp. CCM 8940]MBJ7312823.1 alpha/beta hydrolase [Rugamonas sp. CCM 8940]
MAATVLPEATRRVPLAFDDKGEPVFDTVCSPKSFRMRARGVIPPCHVIPVIFVPGIMGTNLRMNEAANGKKLAAWSPPNGTADGLGEVRKRKAQVPKDRQLQMTASRTEVDDRGKVELPQGVLTLTTDEAVRRGWGQLHFDSYGHVLAELERSLNDQYEEPGKPGSKKMAVWAVAQTLMKNAPIQSCTGEGDPCFRPEMIDVRTVWNAVKGTVSALTEDEFTRLDDFYYPVWAYGYNWLDSNEAAADGLCQRIEEVLAWYDKTKYFMTQGKVILVTHSMGGIVARRAAQKDAGKILGVVHGVQPVCGAPVVYRRFRAGTEVGSFFNFTGAAVATIVGWDAADITCVMANSPGALELLPTKNYPPGWLTVSQNITGEPIVELARALPIADPYEEIYSKRVQDVWWGMVDETLIDPAKLSKDKDSTPMGMYRNALKIAKKLHDTLGLYCHHNTYAHYGSDKQEVSFGKVHWFTNHRLQNSIKAELMGLPAASWTLQGEVNLTYNNNSIKFELANRPGREGGDDADSGDGTVPSPSGATIERTDGAHCVFRMKGFDHQGSYSNRDVVDNVIYCIGKVIQNAMPAKNFPTEKS